MLWCVFTEAQRVEQSGVAEPAAMFNRIDAWLKGSPGTVSKSLHSTLTPPIISAERSPSQNVCCHGMTQPTLNPNRATCTHAARMQVRHTHTRGRIHNTHTNTRACTHALTGAHAHEYKKEGVDRN